ncbi:MAG: hypothetical protein IJ733_18700 [Lachnospiraceae bacterium]|nr:hypothetical protein [Lachnospiraceae bacterium]
MRKKNTLIKSAIICFCMIITAFRASVISYAADMGTPIWEEPVEPMEYISSYGGNLTINSAGTATVTGYIRGKSGVNDAYVKVTLQKKISGTWSNLKSWDDQGGRNAAVEDTYTVTGGIYRVKVYCSAGTEEKTFYSAIRNF